MRPSYHYAPAANWLSDPNGLVHANGEWHLFYQYNPHADQWGHMAWGHAVSDDLAAWEELPPALIEDEQHLIFSGSAVIDETGSAGFGAGAMVAIYTGASRCGTHQVQCLAASTDNGRTWEKYGGNPVLDRGSADFRDPNVFWHAESARWIMVVAMSAENRALLFASADLRAWHELSAIEPAGCPGRLWECPLLIDVPVEGRGQTRWMFKIDVLQGGPGSGTLAVTGMFDGVRFLPDCNADGAADWQIVDHGRDFYAAIAWHAPRDAAGHPCWVGWMGNQGYQADLPSRGWRGAMSVPRRLNLRAERNGLRLVQRIEPAVSDRFDPAMRHRAAHLDLTIPMASALTIDRGDAREYHVRLTDGTGAAVLIDLRDEVLTGRRGMGGGSLFDAPIEVTVPLSAVLRLWCDATTIEIEADDGAFWLGIQHVMRGPTMRLQIHGDAAVSIGLHALRVAART